ncbi:MobF family relaxase [Nocardia asiatica]|uniref:MobF family relaxase n=1 Tax=Nocardia asiatica TaxID=209252 RepID=UPI003EDEF2AE
MTATIHKVVAGNGYQYYLRNVAAHDASSRGRSSLADYYSAHGEAPGVWHGTGLTALGITPGDEVTEEQMKSLFGLGRHPNTDLIETEVYDEQIRLGAKHKDAARAADKASRLGNPYRVYREVSEFRKRCADVFETHNISRGSDPHDGIPDAERARMRTAVATKMFTEEYGRAPIDARELSGWVAKNSRPNTAAVAGFDITFSPVKSVSVLWALAPRSVAEKIEAAHHAAIDDALAWMEQHAVVTRLGRNGVRQVDVDGIVAARFTHRDSRAGDPDLHSHVLIANRVATLDGRWRTLYGAAIYQFSGRHAEVRVVCAGGTVENTFATLGWLGVSLAEDLCHVAFSLAFDVGASTVQRSTESAVLSLGLGQALGEVCEKFSQVGEFIDQVVSVGVVELAGEVADAAVAFPDRVAQRADQGLSVEGALAPGCGVGGKCLVGAGDAGGAGRVAGGQNSFGEFGPASVVDERSSDAGEVADVLDREWRTGFGQLGQGLSDTFLAGGAGMRSLLDHLDRSTAVVGCHRDFVSCWRV